MRKILREIKETLFETIRNWIEDRVPLHGAALAFYTIFSLAPLLIITVSISGFIFSREASANQIASFLQDVIGPEVTKNIMNIMRNVHSHRGNLIATIVGIGILLFGSTTVISQLKSSLDKIWNVAPKPGQTIKAYLLNRLFSLLTILILSVLLVTSLIFEGLLALLKPALDVIIPLGVPFWNMINEIASKAITLLLFTFIIKFLPDIKIRWRTAFAGALTTMVLFELGKYLIGVYLSVGNLTSTYGAAGSLVIFLVWVYYNALIVYSGAEFTHVLMRRYEPSIETYRHAHLLDYPDDDWDVDTDALP